MSLDGEFFVCTTGAIEFAEFYEIDNAYCKYGYHFGNEWTVVAGIEEGLTQMSNCSNDVRRLAVWNFPIDVTFRSSNPHGWPQLVLSIYGMDFIGHDVIRGYGVCHLPFTTGRHEKKVSVYALESSSPMQKITAWLTGRRPELIEPSIVASAAGREYFADFSDTHEGSGEDYDNVSRRVEGFRQAGLRQWGEAQMNCKTNIKMGSVRLLQNFSLDCSMKFALHMSIRKDFVNPLFINELILCLFFIIRLS